MRLNMKRLLTSLAVTLASFCLACIFFEKMQFTEKFLMENLAQKNDFSAVIEIQESLANSTDGKILEDRKNLLPDKRNERQMPPEKSGSPENFEKSGENEKKSVQNVENADFTETELKNEKTLSQMENLQPESVSSFSNSDEGQLAEKPEVAVQEAMKHALQEDMQQASLQSDLEKPDGLKNEKTAKKMAAYKAYVLRKIAMHKNYPAAARTKGLTGRTRLCLTIYDGGKNCSVKIISSSGHEILDDASEKSVKDALPFKKLPESIEKAEIIFSMDFTLE